MLVLYEKNKERKWRMFECHCGKAMIRADYYEPEGTVLLYGMVEDEKGFMWVCMVCGHDPNNKSPDRNSEN